MKKIIVAGGAGFIGMNLCRALLEKGNKVVCIDNLHTGTYSNIEPLLTGSRDFRFIRHDIVDRIDEESDFIINLACPASPVYYQRDPVGTLKTSVIGTLNMLELAKKNRAVMLQASTSEVYGDPNVHPQTEDYWGHVNPTGPRACYDEGKRCAETLCFDFMRHHGVDVRVVRIFNTYGPGMQTGDGRVVSNFIMQALIGEDITIYGDGSQTRSFCYVDDLVRGLIRMMNAESPKTSGRIEVHGPVNLGNPGEFTVRELAEKILAMTDSQSRIVFDPLPEDDPRRRKPDIGKARRLLDWEPVVGLDEGLERTITYFMEGGQK